MVAPVSLCIIVKNEPLLEQCVKSLRDYVKEVVIVDTGSTDGTAEIAQRLADVYEQYTACNDPETGLIENFSQARQRSFELATQPWIMWVDADDIVSGGENLLRIINLPTKNKFTNYMFPYEYSYDANGNCICLHYRERLFSSKDNFKWENPVHEVCGSIDPSKTEYVLEESIVIKHQRQHSSKVVEPGRNLRILKKYIEKVGDSDARQLYYVGLEYYNNGFLQEAIDYLTKYVDLSGWDDERAMACLKLVDVYQALGDQPNGIKWAFKTVEIKENWAEGYFALGRMFYYVAQKGGPNEYRNWERCVYFCKAGLALPPTKTLLFINPLDRDYDIHRYLNVALHRSGNIIGALDSANIGLRSRPDDAALLLNKKLYEVWLAKRDAVNCVNKLRELEDIDQGTTDLLGALLQKQATAESLGVNNKWKIPSEFSLNELPGQFTDVQLHASILMIWKQFMLRDEVSAALIFLESVPEAVKNTPKIQEAIELTKYCLQPKINHEQLIAPRHTPSLDIVFFAGEGVEEWTPETVRNTGIGGSEMMLLEQAKRFAALGHKVRVFNSCGFFGRGRYDNVFYEETKKFKDLSCDVLIVSRRADMLADEYNVKAALKLLWIHDVCAINATNELLLKADRILALSEWHKQNIVKVHNVHPDHVIVTRNGIDLTRFEKSVTRDRFKCINSSSPDRSWPILLDVWPRIKQQVPEAELHLYYGFKNWEYTAQFDKGQADLIVFLKNKIAEMAPLGVFYHDRVSPDKLAEEFLSAGCWIHPTWFTETSCITAMEAQAAGLRIVTSSIAALNETVSSRGILIDGDWTTNEYKDKFVQSVVESINNHDDTERLSLQNYAKQKFGLIELTHSWEKMFVELIAEVAAHPMTPYQPTIPYVTGSGYSDGDTRLPDDNPERRKQ